MYSSKNANVKCRTCLVGRRKMRSVFSVVCSHTPCAYADLICSIANVKIRPDDGGSEMICLLCRTKTEEAYEFKLLVQQSSKHFFVENTDISTYNNVNENEVHHEMQNFIKKDKEDGKDSNTFEGGNDPTDFRGIEYEMLGEVTENQNILKTETVVNTSNKIISIKEEPLGLSDNAEEKDWHSDDDRENSDEDYFQKGAKKPRSSHSRNKKRQGWKKLTRCIDNKNTNEEKMIKPKKKRSRPPKIPKTQIPQPKDLICPYCGKIVKAMEAHILTHTGEKKFQCSECPKAYFSLGGLHNHSRVHSKTKYFKCDLCNAEFYRKDSLISHLLSHKNIKDQVCSICNRGFRRKKTLQRHMIRHSSANKNVKCDLCNMTFYEKFNLQHHMRIHTGERPYKCELCSQPYSYKRDFDRHCLKKHGVYVQKRGIRIMNQELLQKERHDVRAALARQKQAESVHSTLSSSSAITEPTLKFIYPHLLDASQLKKLLNI